MQPLDRRALFARVNEVIPGSWPGRGRVDHLRYRLFVLGVVVLLAASLTGIVAAQDAPSPAEELATVLQGPDTSVHYVGIVDDGEIYVAVVDHGASFVDVYLCAGEEFALWLEGSGDAATGAFGANAADGATATGTIADGIASGEVTLADGTVLTFTAPRAVLPAGLYTRVAIEDGEPIQARTIVLPNGTARGKKKAFDCAQSEKFFETWMDLYRSAASGSTDAYIAGNMAHDEFLRARNAGCAYASPTT
jgi:hypothetical protein